MYILHPGHLHPPRYPRYHPSYFMKCIIINGDFMVVVFYAGINGNSIFVIAFVAGNTLAVNTSNLWAIIRNKTYVLVLGCASR